MSTALNKRGSNRASLQRRSTRGPLDADADPLSPGQSFTISPADPTASPLVPSSDLDASITESLTIPDAARDVDSPLLSPDTSKDLSFLLDDSIYHPLTNIDVPAPFRYPLPPPPPPTVPLSKIFSELSGLLTQCHFLSAAHLAAAALTSGVVTATDTTSIFRLLSIRYSALELSGNVALAAQESKALEDLSSNFYYEDNKRLRGDTAASSSDDQPPVVKHIMPFDLRLQALRLQGIGFGDMRRAVGALFDLGMECRDNLARSHLHDRISWEERLLEVGIRVVNALIDMGDLDCARRTLRSMRPEAGNNEATWISRMILLLVKMGEVEEARTLVVKIETDAVTKKLLQAIIDITDGRFDIATSILSENATTEADSSIFAIAKQNLAVAYLYTGAIRQSQQILEDLVKEGYSFQTLTINLATLYDLSSDKSKDLKMGLATKIANQKPAYPQRGFVNADFKL